MENVLGVVGHELRTPLAALRAISEYLLTDGARSTKEANKFLQEISEEVDRMSDTVNNILEAARLNSGKARWNWSESDVRAIMEEAIATVRHLVDKANVDLSIQYHPSDVAIRCDGNAIQRLLINLLSNACKHTKTGHIHLSGRLYDGGGGNWFEFSVKDSGTGVSPAVVARLGQAFALNSGIVGQNHVGGAGLGLAICKGILAAHGGDLLIESTPGKGTTVLARLRADLQAAAFGDTTLSGITEELEV